MADRVVASESRLRASGRRLTSQRRLVLRILEQADGHLDAADIFELGRHQDPHLSLSTVYRTLGALKEAGLVRKLHLDEERHRYELNAEDGHSHLVCAECGRVIEVDSNVFYKAAQSVASGHDFEVAVVQVELTGRCSECRRRASRNQ